MTRSGCVSGDTVTRRARGCASALLCAASLLLAVAAHAEPRQLHAIVVWTRADLIYVVAPDSNELVSGMSLHVMHGKREVAAAAITRMLEPRLAVARLSSGSLANEKRLDKLRVRGEAPVVVRATKLRVGLPGRGRTNLLFACAQVGVSPTLGSTSYGVDSLGAGQYRLVRVPGATDASPAPDTLLVRQFSDVADQEIALERGELDVAVFWPGELSARMRDHERWSFAARGVRARGVLAGVTAAIGHDSCRRE